MIKPTEEQIETFLRESNAIESEYSEEAFEDAKIAWDFGFEQIEKGNKIDLNLIKKIHLKLMRNLYLEIAGKFRKRIIFIGKECIGWEGIIKDLKEWCEIWNNSLPIIKTINETGYSSEELIKDLHIHFEKIHPFSDGNGRTGRILMNIQRLKLGLPLLIIYNKEKSKYYEWFNDLK
jgi:Fic family protein